MYYLNEFPLQTEALEITVERKKEDGNQTSSITRSMP